MNNIKQSPVPSYHAFGGGVGGFQYQSGAVATLWYGARAIWAGGYDTPTNRDTIDYVNIDGSNTNATDFGDLSQSRQYLAGCSNAIRGCFGGGSPGPYRNTIDYITIASTGDAQDFGDLAESRRALTAAGSNIDRGLFAGGYDNSNKDRLDYIVISTLGDATAVGGVLSRRYPAGCSNGDRAIFGGGWGAPGGPSTTTNNIEYQTVASLGGTTDFGDLSQARGAMAAAGSDADIGVFAGGDSGSITNTMGWVTISSTGDATDFGDLSQSRVYPSGSASSTRGCFGGGEVSSPFAGDSDRIDYVTFASLGNATDFGNLSQDRRGPGSTAGTP